MGIRRFITFCLLLVALIGVPDALDASDAPFATLTLNVNRDTLYSIKKGVTTGELLLELERYPANVIQQLENQIGEHLVAVKVASRRGDRLSLVLVIKPVIFGFSHGRQISPHRIVLDILPTSAQSGLGNVPSLPPLPMWEALRLGNVLLPVPDYQAVEGEGASHQAFISAVRLYEMGAHEAALKRLTENLKVAGDPLWDMNLVLYADTAFLTVLGGDGDAERAMRTLMVAEREARQPFFKGRSALMIAHLHLLRDLPRDAAEVLARAARQYPDMLDYIQLAQIQTAINSGDRESARRILDVLAVRRDNEAPIRLQACFFDMLLVTREARITEANEILDRCLAMVADRSHLVPEQLLAAAETRLLGYRFGEAKSLLDMIQRHYPDHPRVPLAALRAADVLEQERRHAGAIDAYDEVARRWPATPFGRLASLRAAELTRFKLREANVTEIWSSLDLHHEDDLVSREARMRLMWLYEAMGRYPLAYSYLVELVRRYRGLDYWPFAPARFRELTLATYRQLDREGDPLSIINQYSAEVPLPLDHEALDEIATLAAKSYAAFGHWRESVRVFLAALDRPNRPIDGERELLTGLTRAYIATGDYFRAEKTQQYFYSRFTGNQDRRDYHYLQGEIEQLRGNLDGAVEGYRAALGFETSAPERRLLLLKIGRVRYLQKRYAEAIEPLTSALELHLDPNVMIEAHIVPRAARNGVFFLADSLTREQRWQEALDVWLRAVILFPDDERAPIARYYAAHCLNRLGRTREALPHYEALGEQGEFWGQVGALNKDITEWFLKHDLNRM